MAQEGNLDKIESKLRGRLSMVSAKMAEKTAHTKPYGLEEMGNDEKLYHYMQLTSTDKISLVQEKGASFIRFAEEMEKLRSKRGV